MSNVVDIFRDLVAGLATTISVNEVVNNGNGTFTFEVDSTKWLRASDSPTTAALNQKVTIGVTDYPILSMVKDTSITVTGVGLGNTATMGVAAPFYLNGTQLATNTKRKKLQFAWQQMPFVWLVEPFPANEDQDEMSIIASQPELTFVFLDNAKSGDWDTRQHYDNILTYLNELVEAFKAKMKVTRSTIGQVTNFVATRRAKWGEPGVAGAISSIIDEKTSGIEVRCTVEIYKEMTTCTN